MKITNGNISVYLPTELHNSDYYEEYPFVVFSCDNFIDKSNYLEFITQMKILFDSADWDKGATGKKRFKYDPEMVEDYDLNPIISDFVGIFKTTEFRNWFKKTHERFYDIGLFGSIFPKNKFLKKILGIINKISRKFFNSKAFNIYTTQVEFSKIGEGASIAPHTDSFNKRMALVFYTPFIDPTPEMISNWGTTFWKAKDGEQTLSSWVSSHKLKEEELKEFYDKNEVSSTISYKANKINGFIKSDLSWHSVERNNLKENRVAIVININDIASTERDIPLIKNIQINLLNKKYKRQTNV